MRFDNGSPATRWGSDPSLLFPCPSSSNPRYSLSRSRLDSPSLPSLAISQDLTRSANLGVLMPQTRGQTLSLISPISSQSPTNNYPPRTQRVSMSSSSSRSVIPFRMESSSSSSFSQSDNVRGQLSSPPSVVPKSPALFFYPSARTRAHPGMRPAPNFKFKTQTRNELMKRHH